jgi:hypothetical protein
MTVDADLVFLPWLRRGASAALRTPDSLGPSQAGIASAMASIEINEADRVSVPVRLIGPGHVTGIDPRQVVRTDPTRGSRTFESNYFPLIEFDEPSLPWLFTPARASAEARLRPWICLVVVAKQEGVRLDPPRFGTMPVLRIRRPASPAAELPNLTESWAWAHAQVTAEGGASAGNLTELLDSRPERSVSRLVSARLLRPDTEYLACVVPTFELGRKAGFGDEVKEADESRLEPAWTPDLVDVDLPVFYHWEFATGAGGDFQSLALLLRARPLPEGIGRRPFDISHSGLGVAFPNGTTMPLSGALQPADAPSPQKWPDAALETAFQAALAEVLNMADVLAAVEDPLLAPPRYGGTHGGLRRLDPARQTRWYEQLNLDPEARVVAQFGTRVIQDHQEALVDSAWTQSGELRRVNGLLRHAQLSCAVASSLHTRHVARMSPEVGLQVLAPAQARMSRSQEANRPETGFVALLQLTGLKPAAYDAGLRRIARPRSPLNRRVQRKSVPIQPQPLPRTTTILRSLRPASFVARLMLPDSGRIGIERVAAALQPPRDDIRWSEATAAAVLAVPPRPRFEIGRPRPTLPHGPIPPVGPIGPVLPTSAIPIHPLPSPDLPDLPKPKPPLPPVIHPPVPLPIPPIPVPPRDSDDARAFRKAAAAHLARFEPPRPQRLVLPQPRAELKDVFVEAVALTAPRATYPKGVRAMIEVAGPDRPDDEALDELRLAPRFPQPMAVPLAEVSQELLLPGLEAVPANTVVPLKTNTRFVEAYMVGLNAEMARELLWREFSAPLDATYFDRFWDTGVAHDAPPDIEPISSWGDRSLGGAAGEDERFVMLVRSELLRRYPDAVIYATRPGASPGDPPEERHPLFTGALDPDVRFFGFGIGVDEIVQWSIVIQEQPTAPRFGIEVGTATGTATHLPPGSGHAANVAQRTRQFPVRITLPSTVLLRED